jgi:radical SAM protein with 4Fe4S-binding SPASM domain
MELRITVRKTMSTCDLNPIVMWEVTRACDLHCRNCTIRATEDPGANQLTTYEAYKTIDQIAAISPREFILTGGDGLAREDLLQIVNYSRRRGLDPSLVVSPTSFLTADALARLARKGLSRIILPLDGPTPAIHKAVRGVADTFTETLHAVDWALKAGLDVEINTLITQQNAEHLAAIAEVLRPFGIARWNLYFLVPMTTSSQSRMLLAAEAERLFGIIDELREQEEFEIRIFEAPHYRRHRLQQSLESRLGEVQSAQWADFTGFVPSEVCTQEDLKASAVDNIRDFVFISHAGDVRCSEFLLFSAGNVRYRPLSAIYHSSDFFGALRDPDNMTGKCGRCEYRHICGGSRARAWAMEGSIFADDPLCIYEPGEALPLPMAMPSISAEEAS